MGKRDTIDADDVTLNFESKQKKSTPGLNIKHFEDL